MDFLAKLSPEQLAALSPEQISAILGADARGEHIATMKSFIKRLVFDSKWGTLTYDLTEYKRFHALLLKYHDEKFYLTTSRRDFGGRYETKQIIIPCELLTESEVKAAYPYYDLVCSFNIRAQPITNTYHDQNLCLGYFLGQSPNLVPIYDDAVLLHNHIKNWKITK